MKMQIKVKACCMALNESPGNDCAKLRMVLDKA